VTRPSRTQDMACLLGLLVLAGGLRLVHLGSTSLWWDEIVQIQTASLPSFADVLWRVRRGDPPGLGNAGAVPLDYLLMHAYFRLVARPQPEWLEIYFRIPAWLCSTAAVGAVFLFVRRYFGRAAALAAGLVLATSVPHALYAGEARFYSLFSLVTVLCLWSFSWVAENPRRGLPWLVHAGVAVLTFLTGLLGLLLLAGQYAILGGLVLRDALHRRGEAGRGLVVPAALTGASAAVFAVVLWRYYRGTWLLLKLQHHDEGRGPWQAIVEVFAYFTLESWLTLALFGIAFAALPLVARRAPSRLAIVLHLGTSFLWIPILAWLASWKGYYVRPRHALFLLPYFAIVVGIGLDEMLRRYLRPRDPSGARTAAMRALAAAALVLVAQGPSAFRSLREPSRYAGAIKPTQDLGRLLRTLAERATSLPEGQVFLLVAERPAGAYLKNPAVAWYLRQYGLTERVLLRTGTTSEDLLARSDTVCVPGCRGRNANGLALALRAGAGIDVRASLRQLLGIDQPPALPPRTVGGLAILRHRRDSRTTAERLAGPPPMGAGWTLFELR
jgi:hypothetical protein